jgi:hypothetical protein
MPHTSRKGWLARFDCYAKNPFTCDIDAERWPTQSHGDLSLRAVAGRIVRRFWQPIRRLSDPHTLRRIAAVVRGRGGSLLALADRPPAYEDVGTLCRWDAQSPPAQLARSRYERVVMRAVSGKPLQLGGRRLRPVGMSGWSAIVIEREQDQRLQVIAIDDLLHHLDHWEH